LFGTTQITKLRETALIGLLAAVCVVSRVTLQFLPNIKPVTAIIIISVFVFSMVFGIKLAVVTVLVSNMILGMGIWTVFQILAWTVIAVIAGLLAKVVKNPRLLPMSFFAALMGYVYGFFVSLDKLLYLGVKGFWVYYISGLPFDTLHAVGNFAFYLVFAPILFNIFTKKEPFNKG